jgi:Domain of unknown function (DUF6597)
MSYRELSPLQCLAPYLSCVGVRDSDEPGLRACVVPDGCIDIGRGQSGLFVAGPATAPVFADLPPRDSIVGARFHPDMAPCLLGIPSSELLDREVAAGARQLSGTLSTGTGIMVRDLMGQFMGPRTEADDSEENDEVPVPGLRV